MEKRGDINPEYTPDLTPGTSEKTAAELDAQDLAGRTSPLFRVRGVDPAGDRHVMIPQPRPMKQY